MQSVVPGAFRTPSGVLGAAVIAVMLMVFAVWAVRQYFWPGAYQAPPSTQQGLLALAMVAVATLVLVAGWIAAFERPPVTIGLAIVSFGWLAPTWSSSAALPARARVALLAVSPAMIAGLHWLMIHGTGNGSAPRKNAAVVWMLTPCAIAILILGYNLFDDPSCLVGCTDSRPALAPWLSRRQAVAWSGGFALAAAVVVGFHARRRPRARLAGVCAVAAPVVASALIVRAVAWSLGWRTEVEAALTTLATLGIAVTVLAAAVAARRTRRAVEELVSELSASRPGRTPSASARTLLFSVPDEDRWIDAVGDDVPDPTMLSRGVTIEGGTIWLDLPKGGRDEFAELAPASRLALRNARLTALGKARLADVQASRLRILTASHLERKRIERDLHDGAQQRLVSTAFQLKLALDHVGAGASDDVSEADRWVGDALDQLRSLAHGIYPSALTDEGLGAALEDLAASADVPTTLSVQLSKDVGSDVSLTAYGLVADYVAAAAMSAIRRPVTVNVRGGAGMLTVTLTGGIEGLGDLTDITDRISAVGGSITTTQATDEVTVTAVIPCAS